MHWKIQFNHLSIRKLSYILSETNNMTPTVNIFPFCPISRNTHETTTAPDGQDGPANLTPCSKILGERLVPKYDDRLQVL